MRPFDVLSVSRDQNYWFYDGHFVAKGCFGQVSRRTTVAAIMIINNMRKIRNDNSLNA